jgi:hypothetical protein
MSDEYKLLSQTGKLIAIGTWDEILRFVKHHVADGRYRIVCSELRMHVLRKNGIVSADPDGVCLQRSSDKTSSIEAKAL